MANAVTKPIKRLIERSEASIEQAAVRALEKRGALAPKYVTPGRRSAPDRIVLPGSGTCFFIEFKKPGKKPTEKQAAEHKKLRARGYQVNVESCTQGALSALDAHIRGLARG